MAGTHGTRMPSERHLQALDLPPHNYAMPRPVYAEEEYVELGHMQKTTRRHERRGDQYNMPMAKAQSSSDPDYSMPQTPSRSWSMIDLPSARNRQIRIQGGADPFACRDDSPEAQAEQFYHSIDPGIDPSNLDSDFQTYENPYLHSTPPLDPCPTPYQRPTISSYNSSSAQGPSTYDSYRRSGQRRPSHVPRQPQFSSQSRSCPQGSIGGQPGMDSYRRMPPPQPPWNARPISEQPMRKLMERDVSLSRSPITAPARFPVQPTQHRRSSASPSDRGHMWDSSYKQQSSGYGMDSTGGHGGSSGVPFRPSGLPMERSNAFMSIPPRHSSVPLPLPISTMGMSQPNTMSSMPPSSMMSSNGPSNMSSMPCMPSSNMMSNMSTGRGHMSYDDKSCPCPDPTIQYGSDPCARQNIQLGICEPKPKEDSCPHDREPMPCGGCGLDVEDAEAVKKNCAFFNPKIAAKMDPSLPKFCIPRGMEEDFNCIKRRELWETLVKDQYCPGAIQESVDGLEDFNLMALNIVFGESRLPDSLPKSLDPITLLEAFNMRINFERCQIKKMEASQRQNETKPTEAETTDDTTQIDNCFRRKYQTELNIAIEKFLKAEKIYNFLHPDPDVALMDLTLDKCNTDVPGVPIKIKAYAGATKPKNP